MTDLADSIKRLRELSKCTEAMTEQSIFKSVRQLNMHYEQGCNDIITLSDGVLSATQTINQLVELVAEMRDELCMAGNVINSENVSAEWLEPIITKADALLNKLGDV